MTSRERILNSIEKAVQAPSDLADLPEGTEKRIAGQLAAITPKNSEDLQARFAEELKKVSGEFVKVESRDRLISFLTETLRKGKIKSLALPGTALTATIANRLAAELPELESVDAAQLDISSRKARIAEIPFALVDVAYAVADTGSLVLLLDEIPSCLPYFLADTVIAILTPDQLVPDLFTLFDRLEPEKTKRMVLITGPSRTADIEKILILGAHGPRHLTVCLLNEPHSNRPIR